MPLTSAQKTALKNDIAANTNTVVHPFFGTVQIKDIAVDDGTGANVIADWYNLKPGTAYWVWATGVTRSAVYNTTTDVPSTWSWTTYKNQSATEQNAWVQIFMGDQANFGQLNVRVGIGNIFSGAGAPSTQRDHCLAVGRRLATSFEKLFSVTVASPPNNTGNDGVANNRGKTSNPDVMVLEGTLDGPTVFDARTTG